MSFRFPLVALFSLCAVFLAGCDASGRGGVAVLDLDAVAKAMGRDKVINEEIQDFAKSQQDKLKQLQSDLQSQVSDANDKLDAAASEEQKASLNAMVIQARSQLTRELGQARQSAQHLRMRLIRDFAVEVQPVAARVAAKKGLQVVMLKQPGILVVASEVDITQDVITQLQLGGE